MSIHRKDTSIPAGFFEIFLFVAVVLPQRMPVNGSCSNLSGNGISPVSSFPERVRLPESSPRQDSSRGVRQDNTDAVISFTNGLTRREHAAVFMHIADPGSELKNALESSYGKPVMVTKADGSESRAL